MILEIVIGTVVIIAAYFIGRRRKYYPFSPCTCVFCDGDLRLRATRGAEVPHWGFEIEGVLLYECKDCGSQKIFLMNAGWFSKWYYHESIKKEDLINKHPWLNDTSPWTIHYDYKASYPPG